MFLLLSMLATFCLISPRLGSWIIRLPPASRPKHRNDCFMFQAAHRTQAFDKRLAAKGSKRPSSAVVQKTQAPIHER